MGKYKNGDPRLEEDMLYDGELLYNLHNHIKVEVSACAWLTNEICIKAVRRISAGENPFLINCLPNGRRFVTDSQINHTGMS